MSTSIYFFHVEMDALEFATRVNNVEHTVNVQRVSNGYQVIVRYWSLD